jgi:hypothetical protein
LLRRRSKGRAAARSRPALRARRVARGTRCPCQHDPRIPCAAAQESALHRDSRVRSRCSCVRSRKSRVRSRRRIASELAKLGHRVDKDTVAKYVPRPTAPPRRPPSQTWKTFLRTHLAGTIAVDFLTVPTVTFDIVYVFFVLSLERRRVLHVNVTAHPYAALGRPSRSWKLFRRGCRPLASDTRPECDLRVARSMREWRIWASGRCGSLRARRAERIRRAVGRDAAARTARPRHRARRGASAPPGPPARRLLQPGPIAHVSRQRCAGRARRRTALRRKGHRPSPRRRPAPPLLEGGVTAADRFFATTAHFPARENLAPPRISCA